MKLFKPWPQWWNYPNRPIVAFSILTYETIRTTSRPHHHVKLFLKKPSCTIALQDYEPKCAQRKRDIENSINIKHHSVLSCCMASILRAFLFLNTVEPYRTSLYSTKLGTLIQAFMKSNLYKGIVNIRTANTKLFNIYIYK